MSASDLNAKTQPVRPPSPWRPVLILVCFVLGFVTFRFIVIDGTLFDQDFKPRWARSNDDLYAVRKAMDKADFDEAERILRALLARQPNYGAARERLGYVLLQKGQLQEALEHYQVAADHQPDDGEIANAIALVKRRMAGGPAGGG